MLQCIYSALQFLFETVLNMFSINKTTDEEVVGIKLSHFLALFIQFKTSFVFTQKCAFVAVSIEYTAFVSTKIWN